MYIYISISISISISIYLSIYLYLYLYTYIFRSGALNRLSYQTMSSARTQSQLCTATTISSFIQRQV